MGAPVRCEMTSAHDRSPMDGSATPEAATSSARATDDPQSSSNDPRRNASPTVPRPWRPT